MDSINFDVLSSQPGLFVPAAGPGTPYFELWRDGPNTITKEGHLKDAEVEAWANQSYPFMVPIARNGHLCCDGVRLIFSRPRPSVRRTSSARIHDHGHVHPFIIPFKRDTFNLLLDRCRLSQQILDLKEIRSMAGCSSGFVVVDESSGSLATKSFLGLIRLHEHTAVLIAYSFNPCTGTSTGIVFQADDAETKDIKEHILHHKANLGHELLLRIIFTEMGLKGSLDHLTDAKQDVMDIEHSTGQHTWDNYSARDEKPKSDVELSRVAHGVKIQVAVVCRRIEVVLIWVELLLESLTDETSNSAKEKASFQWVRNLKTQAKMAKTDVELIAKRADNQVGAVYSRLAQRDNITSQKISEATNRDSSAMKSLAVLGALFYPGTFVAGLFSIDALAGQPFWVYWIITAPLTLIVLGGWIYWTHWRSESVKEQERELDEKVVG